MDKWSAFPCGHKRGLEPLSGYSETCALRDQTHVWQDGALTNPLWPNAVSRAGMELDKPEFARASEDPVSFHQALAILGAPCS